MNVLSEWDCLRIVCVCVFFHLVIYLLYTDLFIFFSFIFYILICLYFFQSYILQTHTYVLTHTRKQTDTHTYEKLQNIKCEHFALRPVRARTAPKFHILPRASLRTASPYFLQTKRKRPNLAFVCRPVSRGGAMSV